MCGGPYETPTLSARRETSDGRERERKEGEKEKQRRREGRRDFMCAPLNYIMISRSIVIFPFPFVAAERLSDLISLCARVRTVFIEFCARIHSLLDMWRVADVLSKFIGLANRLKSIIIVIAYFIAGAAADVVYCCRCRAPTISSSTLLVRKTHTRVCMPNLVQLLQPTENKFSVWPQIWQ